MITSVMFEPFPAHNAIRSSLECERASHPTIQGIAAYVIGTEADDLSAIVRGQARPIRGNRRLPDANNRRLIGRDADCVVTGSRVAHHYRGSGRTDAIAIVARYGISKSEADAGAVDENPNAIARGGHPIEHAINARCRTRD